VPRPPTPHRSFRHDPGALNTATFDHVEARVSQWALRLVDAQPRFDLFVLDVVMPGMRGDELARRLHDRDPETKVIYFTGYADQLLPRRVRCCGKTKQSL
jgi:CheY-like chemotaxis protein